MLFRWAVGPTSAADVAVSVTGSKTTSGMKREAFVGGKRLTDSQHRSHVGFAPFATTTMRWLSGVLSFAIVLIHLGTICQIESLAFPFKHLVLRRRMFALDCNRLNMLTTQTEIL